VESAVGSLIAIGSKPPLAKNREKRKRWDGSRKIRRKRPVAITGSTSSKERAKSREDDTEEDTDDIL